MADKESEAHPCEACAIRAKADARPKSIMARLWRWHTTWCPGWKSYQAHLQTTKP